MMFDLKTYTPWNRILVVGHKYMHEIMLTKLHYFEFADSILFLITSTLYIFNISLLHWQFVYQFYLAWFQCTERITYVRSFSAWSNSRFSVSKQPQTKCLFWSHESHYLSNENGTQFIFASTNFGFNLPSAPLSINILVFNPVSAFSSLSE